MEGGNKSVLSALSDKFSALKDYIIRKKWWSVALLAISAAYYLCLPQELFNDQYSPVLLARNGELLSASIAADGQWRFPKSDTISDKFVEALIAFEDKRFRDHPGVDVFSIGRAISQNISKRKVVSGASTISMQVIRLSRKGNSRTLYEKLLEIVLATRLELRYSKNEILSLYAAHAPFGGNVVGLEAACWRYFGNSSKELSWAEAALLAVLPNAPALIHPGRNRAELKAKRDRLLDKLVLFGKIDELSCALAKEEPVPEIPFALPQHARHLLVRGVKDGHINKKITSTVDFALQHRTEQIVQDHHDRLKSNRIYNIAALVIDVQTGEVLSYVGNAGFDKKHGNDVDVITAARSTGSILKPFLYAAMLDDGKILPGSLLPDVPTFINGFSPKNFSHEFDGAVHADQALVRSLNVPAVHMLRDYRYERFHDLLKRVGMTTLKQGPDRYGLSLILGGAEGTLWDITGMYASMARTLNNFFERPGKNKYAKRDFRSPSYLKSPSEEIMILEGSGPISAGSVYITLNTLTELHRPGEESGWKYFNSAKKIAWKTGTSFGFRDAWAVGVTPNYAVGVWVGNAEGEGRPGLTGTDAAAPIMFDIFSQLPNDTWFLPPSLELEKISVCTSSGSRATSICHNTDTVFVTKAGLSSGLCVDHRMVHLTYDEKYRVNSLCEDVNRMKHKSWFVLPPVQEYYFRAINLSYKSLPPFKSSCHVDEQFASMDMIYPKDKTKLFIPRSLDGSPGSSIFELAHRNSKATVFWHLDGKYLGSTQSVHQIAVNPVKGKHTLTLVDDSGESITRQFEVVSSM